MLRYLNVLTEVPSLVGSGIEVLKSKLVFGPLLLASIAIMFLGFSYDELAGREVINGITSGSITFHLLAAAIAIKYFYTLPSKVQWVPPIFAALVVVGGATGTLPALSVQTDAIELYIHTETISNFCFQYENWKWVIAILMLYTYIMKK